MQTVQLLLSKSGVAVNTINTDGLTTLDVLLQRNQSELSVIDGIHKILKDAGATKARVAPARQSSNVSNCLNNKRREEKNSSWVRERWSALMVVSVLIATVTFEAGLNPPNGDSNNEEIAYDYHLGFMVFDTTGFLVSLSIIILLISKPPLRPTIMMRVLTALMWISVSSIAITFSTFIYIVVPGRKVAAVPLLWLGLLYLWQFIRFVLWLFRACGALKKRKTSDIVSDIEI